jgi:UDP-2-acetamido-3-amino-2,3-dideoxy-glucuronate N-acetyltransferase
MLNGGKPVLTVGVDGAGRSIHPKASIGKTTKIHAFVFIEEDVVIGEGCIIKPFTYICNGVMILNNVFIGPGVLFTNDKYPQAYTSKFEKLTTIVGKGASIGAGCTILPGVVIGEHATIGAGSVVTKEVKPYTVVFGNPARKVDLRGIVDRP